MNRVKRFTDAFARNIKADEKRVDYTEGNGFCLRVTPKGIKSWVYSFKFNGKSKRMTLAHYPNKSVADARKLFNNAQDLKESGIDPIQQKKDESDAKKQSQNNTLSFYLDHEYTAYMQRAISGEIYLAKIHNHFPQLLEKPLADINKTDLTTWLQNQMKKYNNHEYGYSSESIKSRYSSLKSLMSHAVRNNVISNTPFDLMEKLEFHRDESTQQQAKRTYLSKDQQKALLLSINNYDRKLRTERQNSRSHGQSHLPSLDNLAFASHHKPMLLIHYYMGLRGGDVIGLEWPHIIDIPSATNITKVLEKTRRIVKTPYTLPMPEPVQKALREWKEQQGNPTKGLVFPSAVTGRRMDKKCLSRSWKWIKKDANLPEDLQLYTLRHNFISWLVMEGTPMKVIAELSGHKTTTMIETHYGHLSDCVTQQASNSFASLLSE